MTLPSILSSPLFAVIINTARISDIVACMFGMLCLFLSCLSNSFSAAAAPPHRPAGLHNECKCCRIVDCMFLFCFASEGHDMQTVMKSQPELHWGRSSGSPRFMSRSEANSKFPKAQLLYYTGLCNVNMFGINFHRRLHPFPALSPLPPSSSISALCWRSTMTILRLPEGLTLVIAAPLSERLYATRKILGTEW